ncbi:MAG: 5,10-methylenetetrahydrofolate reductase [Deltaproteobacteria bacterium]|nr:5,10-methylenetetrahydrofolate reductase [Deltaproteobacteria bacterium]
MVFQEKLQRGNFVITCEVNPPKGADVAERLREVEVFRGRVDALSVTDGKSSVMSMTPLAFSHFLREKGWEPILNISCRDRNRLALQADLLGAAALGIQNVLVVTGDYASMGDHPQAKPVFDLDSIQLLQAIQSLQGGQDLGKNVLKGRPAFFAGATVSPIPNTEAALELQLVKMEKKVQAGARFFQTQPVFDLGAFERFMKRASGFGVPVLASVLPLKSVSMARFLNKNMPGVFVPEGLIDELGSAGDRVKASVEMSARIIRGLKGICRGVHFIPAGWEKTAPAIIEAAKL